MRKVIAITTVVIVIAAFFSLAASSSYATDKIGLGIDFYRERDKEQITPTSYAYYNSYNRDRDSNEFRLYYEHLLEQQPVGIQLEFGYAHFEDNESSEYNYEKDRADLVGFLKYYFPLKGETSVYIGGGVGLTYAEIKTADDDYREEKCWIELIEQAAVGVQFPLMKNLTVFIEDRFINEISDGHLRVGLYLSL